MARTATLDDDDVFDERPKRRRRSLDESDDAEQRPRRRTLDDDSDDEPRGRKRRSLDDDADDEESRPRRNRRAQQDEGDDEAEERRHRKNAASKRGVAGWDEFETTSSSGGTDFEAKAALKLKVTEEQQLLKLLDSAPFDSMGLHYVKEIRTGKRSFRCGGEACPLCDDLDHYARKLAYFNVAVFNEDTNAWENRVWEVGVKVGRKLKAINDDKKRGPLDKPSLYVAISKTGMKTATEYHLETVKGRDLDEDWDVDEIDDQTYKSLTEKLYTEQWEHFSTPQELKRVVKRLLDDDGEEDDD
ncbi:hypothetical protein GCM10010331_45300 [Streptomyces xanthochromogenes]|uniref:hypothetical protein n=1 Tax=Streptomyces xanthochromogenes TaxID=67384 RepID=UPI00167C2A13|nr:hypothetical protein [Streptomyces xanthochromogenes]GHB52606.1 hypothetical protein GCM10010331_45300 [Streptomyces xanthochromogenes]